MKHMTQTWYKIAQEDPFENYEAWEGDVDDAEVDKIANKIEWSSAMGLPPLDAIKWFMRKIEELSEYDHPTRVFAVFLANHPALTCHLPGFIKPAMIVVETIRKDNSGFEGKYVVVFCDIVDGKTDRYTLILDDASVHQGEKSLQGFVLKATWEAVKSMMESMSTMPFEDQKEFAKNISTHTVTAR